MVFEPLKSEKEYRFCQFINGLNSGINFQGNQGAMVGGGGGGWYKRISLFSSISKCILKEKSSQCLSSSKALVFFLKRRNRFTN